MKKVTFLVIGFLLGLIPIQAQNWDSVGCNGLWNECGGYTYSANCLMVYNGALYVGGPISGTVYVQANDIAKWNGSSWDSLGTGIRALCPSGPEAMTVYNGNLIVGGYNMFQAGAVPVNNIASWNDTIWAKLGKGISVDGRIIGMAVYSGDLYVTGIFDTAGGIPVSNIAMWNGFSWSALGAGISGIGSGGYALCVDNGKLYVGGHFSSAGGNPAYNIAIWDGYNWSALPRGDIDSGYVNCFGIYNGNLYAGGNFNMAGNVKVNNIAQWNGTSWSAVGSGVQGNYHIVSSLQNYNGNLYAGGTFDTAGGSAVDNFAEWDGANWHYTPGFTGSPNFPLETAWVSALAVYNGYMFAGGSFNSAGRVPTIDIAGSYGGGTGINDLSAKYEIKVYPNPNTGKFTLEVSDAESSLKNMEVYNILGNEVFSGTLPSYQVSSIIDLGSQPNGVYFYRVLAENGNLLGQGKIVIQK